MSRPPEAPALLEVLDLHTIFWTGAGVVRAVDGVSFTIREGERFGLVGESGCGKSVTATSIMGLIDPPNGEILAGEIRYRGRDLLTLGEAEMSRVRGSEIAMVFQDPLTALNPTFTIGDQVIETIRLHRGLRGRAARDVALESLAAVQIPFPARRLGDYPHQFSGGMRQRVVIAMALACNPSLLIADEPTTALDVTTQAKILDLIARLAEERRMAVLLITHDLGVVAGFCDRIHVMYAGRIVERSPVDALYREPLHPYTEALLGSTAPVRRTLSDRLPAIGGAPPSLVAPPSGCPFHPRCRYAQPICVTDVPELIGPGPDREAACHFVGQLGLRGPSAGTTGAAPGKGR